MRYTSSNDKASPLYLGAATYALVLGSNSARFHRGPVDSEFPDKRINFF